MPPILTADPKMATLGADLSKLSDELRAALVAAVKTGIARL